MVFMYTNSTYTSDRELSREITLEDMKSMEVRQGTKTKFNAKKT